MVQVGSEHYAFSEYMSKPRWMSVWYQLSEVSKAKPGSVLEVGIGGGSFVAEMRLICPEVISFDWDKQLGPDCVGLAEALPFLPDSFDLSASFQTLEHMPYKSSVKTFGELCRVARKTVVISLPDSRKGWSIQVKLPFIGARSLLFRPPRIPAAHQFDGEHYWEIGKRGYPLNRVVRDFEDEGAALRYTYQPVEIPYHRFMVFEVT